MALFRFFKNFVTMVHAHIWSMPWVLLMVRRICLCQLHWTCKVLPVFKLVKAHHVMSQHSFNIDTHIMILCIIIFCNLQKFIILIPMYVEIYTNIHMIFFCNLQKLILIYPSSVGESALLAIHQNETRSSRNVM